MGDLNNLNELISCANEFIYDNTPISHYNRYYHEKKKTFSKKKLAYKYSDANGRLPIFSVDCNATTASKVYVVTGYCRWWSDYVSAKPDSRYAYEVVIPDMPCHLYVDMEAEFRTNPELKSLVNIKFKELMDELVRFMYITYLAPTECLDNLEFIILDSSKESKFSKHCIIKIPGVNYTPSWVVIFC